MLLSFPLRNSVALPGSPNLLRSSSIKGFLLSLPAAAVENCVRATKNFSNILCQQFVTYRLEKDSWSLLTSMSAASTFGRGQFGLRHTCGHRKFQKLLSYRKSSYTDNNDWT